MARREHSKVELCRKLQQRTEHPLALIEQVIDELAELGLQSDSRFVEVYIRSRAARGFGPQRIQQELSDRGIDGTVINDYLAHQEIGWQELIQKVWQKRFKGQKPTDWKMRSLQMRFLQYRGFTAEQIDSLFSTL